MLNLDDECNSRNNRASDSETKSGTPSDSLHNFNANTKVFYAQMYTPRINDGSDTQRENLNSKNKISIDNSTL